MGWRWWTMLKPYRYMADQYEGDPEPNLEEYMAAGHVAYAHKATEGVTHIDTAHARRVRRAHEVGLVVVHYHFARPDTYSAPRVEAGAFWRAVRPLWRPGDRLALDLEPCPGKAWPDRAGYAQALYVAVHAVAEIAPAVYGSTSFLRTKLPIGWLRWRRRWEAAYGPPPPNRPWMTPRWAWQFSDGQTGPYPHHLAGIPRGDISTISLPFALACRTRTARRRRRVRKQPC